MDRQDDDAPGLIVIGMSIAFASIVIAFFAAVLQKLLRSAIDIKSAKLWTASPGIFRNINHLR